MPEDARMTTFMNPQELDVFYSVVTTTEIWREDPFDVKTIHMEAREVFQSLLNITSTMSPGHILLIKGESGAGKTHLMRYFRNHIHSRNAGYFGYLQLTSSSKDYGQFILSSLIDSLNQPYEPNSEITGLMRLSNTLAETTEGMYKYVKMGTKRARILDALREWSDLNSITLSKLVGLATRSVINDPRFHSVDHNLVSALLYLQVQDPFIKNVVVHFLRTQTISDLNQEAVQALVSTAHVLSSVKIIKEIAKLMWACNEQALIIGVDQLEGLLYLPDKDEKIIAALGALVDLVDGVSSCLVVVSCLEDFYTEIERVIPAPIRTKLAVIFRRRG